MEACKALNEANSDGTCFFLPYEHSVVTAVRGPTETVLIEHQRGRPLSSLSTRKLFELAEAMFAARGAVCPELHRRVQQEVLRRVLGSS